MLSLDLLQLGFSKGVFLGIAGSLIGGALVRLAGAGAVPAGRMLVQAPALLLLALAAGFVAPCTQFMRWSDPRQAGVDFTVFQCMDAALSLGGVAAGLVAQSLGYALFFGAAAPALAAAPLLAILGDEP